jgi:cation diffusion facilitator CzcD-associated flavoprotein CzcO
MYHRLYFLEEEALNIRQGGDGPRIAIIGSGFSGICLGIQLKKAGIHSFTIFEKADRLGGTWRDNTYPGAACDVPAFSYCFSFEQKTDWTRKWAGQDELLAYMDHCAEKYGIVPHVRFGAEVVSAHFDEATAVWRLRTGAGKNTEAEVLISAVGQLNRPKVPDIPGLGDFRGEQFHSARWNHEYDLTGKRASVIGNAASAIQFIPQIAKEVEHLTVFQRSANWMIPRMDRAYSRKEIDRFARHPWLAKLYRWWIWGSFELRYPVVFHAGSRLGRLFERMAKKYMRSIITDPKLQAALVPDYPIGARRILISDDYYSALERENVEVVTAGIERVSEDGVVDREGRTHTADAIILATGFRSTEFLAPMEIRGLEGRSLEMEWKEGAQAYLGITVSGFPNFFMAYGPNTNLGHNSIIFMIECQTRYILQCIDRLRKGDLAFLDLRPEVQAAFNTKIQAELRRTVWAETDHSWYKDEAGRITNNWSGTTTRFWWKTRKLELSGYRQVARTPADP